MKDQSRSSTSNPYITAGAGNAWSTEAAGLGVTGKQRLLDVGTSEPSADVRGALELSVGELVVVRRRLMLLDERPVEIASSYFPAAIAAGTSLAQPGKIRGGAIAALSALGHAPEQVREQVTARWPDGDEAATLAVDPQEPLLVLIRTSHDAGGRPVEHAVNCMVASRNTPLVYCTRIAS